MNLEDQLRCALRRPEPPAGFAERVLARAAVQTEAPTRPWWRIPGIRLAWVAACALLVGLAGAGYRQWQGEMAKRKTLLALAAAGGEMRTAQMRVRHILAARTGVPSETDARMGDQ